MNPNRMGAKWNQNNAIQYITLQYTKQFKNTIIQIEKNEMKPNVNKSNRNQTKQNETKYIIQYIALQHTIQYNKLYNPNTENPKETKQKRNLTKWIQTKSNQHYNTINNNIILNFTTIRNLMTLKTLDVHRTPPNA